MFSLAFSLFAISSCNKEEDTLNTQPNKTTPNSNPKESNNYLKYEKFEEGNGEDTINGTLLIKFRDEVNLNQATDKPLAQAIWQMETYFNIKYGLKDGINGKFGGDVKETKLFEFSVPSYTKNNDIFVSGNDLISKYINTRDDIFTWINGEGLVFADFTILEINENNTKFGVRIISGIGTIAPVTPKRILRYGQQCELPANFTTTWTAFPSTNDGPYGSNTGFMRLLNPNTNVYQNTNAEYTYVWENYNHVNYYWDHKNENHPNDYPYNQIAASTINQWYSSPWTDPDTLLKVYLDFFITPNYHGYGEGDDGDGVMLLYIWSWYDPLVSLKFEHALTYYVASKHWIPNNVFSQL